MHWWPEEKWEHPLMWQRAWASTEVQGDTNVRCLYNKLQIFKIQWVVVVFFLRVWTSVWTKRWPVSFLRAAVRPGWCTVCVGWKINGFVSMGLGWVLFHRALQYSKHSAVARTVINVNSEVTAEDTLNLRSDRRGKVAEPGRTGDWRVFFPVQARQAQMLSSKYRFLLQQWCKL